MLYVEILSNVPSHPNILHPDKPDHLGSLRDGPGGAGVADPDPAGDVGGVDLLTLGHLLVGGVVPPMVTQHGHAVPHGAQQESVLSPNMVSNA